MRDSELNDSNITQHNLLIVYWWMEFLFRFKFRNYTPLLQRNMLPPSSGLNEFVQVTVQWWGWGCGSDMYAGYQSEPWDRMKGWFVVGA